MRNKWKKYQTNNIYKVSFSTGTVASLGIRSHFNSSDYYTGKSLNGKCISIFIFLQANFQKIARDSV